MELELRSRAEDIVLAYGLEPAPVLALKLLTEPGVYLIERQVRLLAELAGLGANDPLVAGLAPAYAFLAAHYTLADALLDAQAHIHDTLLLSYKLLALAYSAIEQVADERIDARDRATMRRQLMSRLEERDAALAAEAELREGWTAPGDADYAATIGRSNATIAIYDVFRALQGLTPEPDALAVISDLIYTQQLGDDLEDWEEDYEAGNHTVLLRRCAARIGAAGPAREQIERELTLGGLFEEYTAERIRSLDHIALRIESLPGPRMEQALRYVALFRAQAVEKLSDVIETKLEHVRSSR